jgi:equilibrative nucleoside transporter 1/2/3
VRGILLFLLGNTQKGRILGCVTYFTLAAAFLMVCFFLHQAFKTSKFARLHLPNSVLTAVDQEEITRTLIQADEKSNQKDPKKKKAKLHKVLWLVMPMPLMMVINYLQTFMLFPGITLLQTSTFLTDKSWAGLMYITIYNLFDSVGKLLTEYRKAYNFWTITILFFLRFVFYYSFYLIVSTDNAITNQDWFRILNTALFAASNGYVTSALFVLASEKARSENKTATGFGMTMSLFAGISSGTIAALPLKTLFVG